MLQVPTTYVTEKNKEENYLEIYIFQASCPLSLPFLTNQYWNSCHSNANCLYLHNSYITKYDFMNYAFAKLVVAWL